MVKLNHLIEILENSGEQS